MTTHMTGAIGNRANGYKTELRTGRVRNVLHTERTQTIQGAIDQ